MIKKIIICILFQTIVSYSFSQNWSGLDANILKSLGTRSIYGDSISGLLYVSGLFNQNSGNPSLFNHIAVWNGVTWDSLGHGLGGNGLSITKYKNNVIVGGAFNSAGNTSNINNIASWNGMMWDSLGNGANDAINHMLVHNDTLLAFGVFDSAGYVSASKVAKWDGVKWEAFDTTKWVNNGIFDAVFYNNELYIAGNFRNYDGTIKNLAKWTGTQWMPVGNNVMQYSWWVNAIAIYNNELYIGGYFKKSEGAPGDYIIKWNGIHWEEVGGGICCNQVSTLHVFENNLYAGGQFLYAGNVPAYFISKWDDTKWCSFGGFINGGIEVITSFNSELLIGGGFTEIDGDTTLESIAKWTGGSYVDTCGNTTSIKEHPNNENGITFYPNPTTENIIIDIPDGKMTPYSLQLLDVTGRLIKEEYSIWDKNRIVDVSNFKPGLYFIKLTGSKCIYQGKFIKQ